MIKQGNLFGELTITEDPPTWVQTTPVMDSFYNSTNLTGPALKEAKFKVGSQNFNILTLFESSKDRGFTVSEVVKLGYGPLRSVARAVSDLVHKYHKLIYTGEQRIGPEGRLENVAQAI